MKLGVKLGLQAIFFATLLAVTLGVSPYVAAAENVTPPVPQSELLYRVRYGAPWRGELAERYFIERNIALATTLGVVGDDDPDGDGWAIVGHTGTDYDGKKIGGFSISSKKVPSIMLYWDSDRRCSLLTPMSLAIVKPEEDRLLKAQVQRICFAPSTDINVTILQPPLAPATQATDQPIQADPTPTISQQQPVTIAPPIQQAIDPQTFDVPDPVPSVGVVEGVSTTKQVVISHIDVNREDASEPTGKPMSELWTEVPIIFAGVVGAVILVRFLLFMRP